MNNFDELSFTFMMDIYRVKIKAIKRDDKKALKNLEQHYPELFTEDFNQFINNLHLCVEYIHIQHGQDFRAMLEPDVDIIETSRH